MNHVESEWIKNGKDQKGVQTYKNKVTGKCKRAEYKGVNNETKTMAVMMYLKGLSYRSIADVIGVSHVTIMNWVKGIYHEMNNIPLVDPNRSFNDVEIDEMWHFLKKKISKSGFSLPSIEKPMRSLTSN